jgi:hypothetical protein
MSLAHSDSIWDCELHVHLERGIHVALVSSSTVVDVYVYVEHNLDIDSELSITTDTTQVLLNLVNWFVACCCFCLYCECYEMRCDAAYSTGSCGAFVWSHLSLQRAKSLPAIRLADSTS